LTILHVMHCTCMQTPAGAQAAGPMLLVVLQVCTAYCSQHARWWLLHCRATLHSKLCLLKAACWIISCASG
jgi:hypothetical protein